MKINTGGPAYPTITCDEAALSNGGSYVQDAGMTLRDWFAGMALSRIAVPNSAEWSAARAYQMADAMLAERSKEA